MSRSKIENKLEEEILHRIGLLLDKPVSPKATKQLIDAIDHPSSPKQRILNLLLTKFRGELILLMIEKYPYILADQPSIASTFSNLQMNMMKYSNDVMISIWKSLMKIIFSQQGKSANENQQMIYKYTYEDLLKEGVKVTNLQKKDRIFEVIMKNVECFSELGLKDNLRKVIGTYVEIFKKFPIAVPHYVKVITLIVNLIKRSHQQADEKQQHTAIKLQKLPQINDDYLTQIILQLNNILVTTKQKPLHALHNECLVAVEAVLSSKGKRILVNDLSYSLRKTVEVYLYRKGTRDQARKVSLILNKAIDLQQIQNQQKMMRQYSSSKISEKINEKPVLIENVIQKTNQFLAKYEVNNIGTNVNRNGNQAQGYHLNSRYLKKGQGMGGGKAILQLNEQRVGLNKQKRSSIKNKDRFQLLLENCLQKCEWQKNEKNAFVKVNKNQEDKVKIKSNQKDKKNPSLNRFEQFQESIYSRFEEDEFGRGQNRGLKQSQQEENGGRSNSQQRRRQFDQVEIEEINELIELAYSYKFSVS